MNQRIPNTRRNPKLEEFLHAYRRIKNKRGPSTVEEWAGWVIHRGILSSKWWEECKFPRADLAEQVSDLLEDAFGLSEQSTQQG